MRGCWWLLLPLSLGLCVSGWAKTINVPKDQPTIQAGIDAASNGDTVLVAAGAYYENINFKGKAITVISSDGPGTTAIDGGHKDVVVLFNSGETRDTVLKGFTILHGGPGTTAEALGGGIGISSSAPSILNNLITGNDCEGISSYSSAALIQGNVVSDTADTHTGYCTVSGVGILVSKTSVLNGLVTVLTGNHILDNTESDVATESLVPSGGGVNIAAAEGTILQNNVINNNAAYMGAGGIQVTDTRSIQLFQNVIYKNVGNGGLAGGLDIYVQGDQTGPFSSVIANNTFYGNESTSNSPILPDIYLENANGNFLLANNIVEVTAHSNDQVGCIFDNAGPADVLPTVFYLDLISTVSEYVVPHCGVTENLYVFDPMFVDPANGDFHLKPGSHAVDQANANVLPILDVLAGKYGLDVTKDADGNPRLQDTVGYGRALMDLGPYEAPGTLDQPSVQTVLTASEYHAAAGDKITLTAHSTSTRGTPQGMVLFDRTAYISNSRDQGTLDSSGTVSVTTGPLPPGENLFQAIYAGGSYQDEFVSVPLNIPVAGAIPQITIKSSLNPSASGQAVTFMSTVRGSMGIPTGTVTFTDFSLGTTLATVTLDGNGHANTTTSSLATGTHNIQASYNGDKVYEPNEVDVVVQVVTGTSVSATGTALASNVNPAQAGQTVTFSAAVSGSGSGTPDGMVAFLDGTTALGTVQLNAGSAILATAALAVGTHSITATYAGSASYAASTSSILREVVTASPPAATVTTLSSSLNPALSGQAVTFVGTVTGMSGVPDGAVKFLDGTRLLGTTQLSSGTVSYTASFAGDWQPFDHCDICRRCAICGQYFSGAG